MNRVYLKKIKPYTLTLFSVFLLFCILIPFHNTHAEVFDAGKLITAPFDTIGNYIGDILIAIAGFITFLMGALFSGSMYFTLHITELANAPAITVGWRVSRDVANLVFIFILLYIAIKTILGDNPGKLLVSIIITALLVNFSLFFTKIAIDASNILALQFYNAIQVSGAGAFDPSNGSTYGAGLAAPFMKALALETNLTGDVQKITGWTGAGNLAANMLASTLQRFIAITFSVVIMLIAAFVFLAGAVLFIIRTVVLLFIMILAPLAVISRLLPRASTIWDMWSKALIDQLIFAPVFMMLIYMVIKIIQTDAFKKLGNINSGGTASAAYANAAGMLGVLINYSFVIAFLIGVIIISKKIGVAGSSTVTKWGQNLRASAQNLRTSAQSFAGRQTIGRFSSWADTKVGATQFGKSAAGSTLREMTTGAMAKSTFGGKASYKSREEDRKVELAKQVEKVGSDASKIYTLGTMKGGLVGFTGNDRQKIYEKMTDRQKILFENTAREKNDTETLNAIAGYKGKLNRDQKEKLEESFIREFRENPKKLAQHIINLPPDIQNHVYDKLSARDRIAVEAEIKGGAGRAVPATLTEQQAIEQTINNLRSKLSPEEREKTEKNDRETSAKQSANTTKQGIERLAETIRSNAAYTVSDDDKAKIASIKEKDLKEYDAETLTTIAPYLRGSQMKSVSENNPNLSAEEHTAIAQAKFKPIVNALGGGILSVPTTGTGVQGAILDLELNKMTPDEIGSLHEDILKNPNIIDRLEPADLEAIVRKGPNKGVRQTISARIAGNKNHPAYNYLSSTPAGNYWGFRTPAPTMSTTPSSPKRTSATPSPGSII